MLSDFLSLHVFLIIIKKTTEREKELGKNNIKVFIGCFIQPYRFYFRSSQVKIYVTLEIVIENRPVFVRNFF